MKKISHLLLLSIFLASCANAATPTPNVAVTRFVEVTATYTPAPTSTATEIPPTPTETPDPNRPPDATGQDVDGYYKEVDGVKYRQIEFASGESIWAFSMVSKPSGELYLWYYSQTRAAIPFQIYVEPEIPGASTLPLISQNQDQELMLTFDGFFSGAIKQNLPDKYKDTVVGNTFYAETVLKAMNNGNYVVHFNNEGEQTESGQFEWNLKQPAKVIFRYAEANEVPKDTVKYYIIGKSELSYYTRFSSDGQSLVYEMFLQSFEGYKKEDVFQMILGGVTNPVIGHYALQILTKNSSGIFDVDN